MGGVAASFLIDGSFAVVPGAVAVGDGESVLRGLEVDAPPPHDTSNGRKAKQVPMTIRSLVVWRCRCGVM